MVNEVVGTVVAIILAAAGVLGGVQSAGTVDTVATGVGECCVHVTDAEVDMLAKLLYREARGVKSETEQAAVVWCVLNRVSDNRWPDTVEGVVTQHGQFAWRVDTPVTAELRALAADVVGRWQCEQAGGADVGRVLPAEYVFFSGKDGRNWFRMKYRGGRRWDWSLGSPYEAQK